MSGPIEHEPDDLGWTGPIRRTCPATGVECFEDKRCKPGDYRGPCWLYGEWGLKEEDEGGEG